MKAKVKAQPKEKKPVGKAPLQDRMDDIIRGKIGQKTSKKPAANSSMRKCDDDGDESGEDRTGIARDTQKACPDVFHDSK